MARGTKTRSAGDQSASAVERNVKVTVSNSKYATLLLLRCPLYVNMLTSLRRATNEQDTDGNATMASTSLLSLPAELKNHIYGLVLIERSWVNLREGQNKIARGTKLMYPRVTSWKEPALLRVCKEIRSEALPLYYGSNAFAVSVYSKYSLAFLENICVFREDAR